MNDKAFEDFKTKILELKESIPSKYDKCIKNEYQTRNSLIDILIKAWGYDLEDPDEVYVEPPADVSKKGKRKHVDYTVYVGGIVSIMMESKSVEQTLEDDPEYRQLYDYYSNCRESRKKIAIYTNGLEYRFFADIEMKNLIDKEPYYIVDIQTIDEDGMRFLYKFSKHCFDYVSLKELAKQEKLKIEKAKTLQILETWFSQEIKQPSDAVMRLILKESGVVKTMTSKQLDKYHPWVVEAFKNVSVKRYGGSDEATPNKRQAKRKKASAPEKTEAVAIVLKGRKYDATGWYYYADGHVRVNKGSVIVLEDNKDVAQQNKKFKEEVIEDGLVKDRKVLVDAEFPNLSAAAAFITGNASDGWNKSWRLEEKPETLLSDLIPDDERPELKKWQPRIVE